MYYKIAGLVLLTSTFGVPARGQSSSSTVSGIVPAGRGVTGDYSGKWRPQLHFSAPQGFINDPNGMFLDANGTYHLYYQYNPTQTFAGFQHWGHATSQDLYMWENQAIVLSPSNASEGIFSGSAVIDPNNTSSFFPNQTNGVLAYYTINGPYEQTQNVAYSFDDGYSFTKYAGNPVLAIGHNSFRDPKVLWYEDHWVMVLAFSQDLTLGIYTSKNGLDWAHASNFSSRGLLGTQYECPNLVEIPMQGSNQTVWLMYLSINPGAPHGGSIGQYFIGNFNGTHYEAVDAVARIADWGKDNYATQFFANIPGSRKQVSIAWASNWQYTNFVPTGPAEGWQSTMSLPRVNYIKNATRTGYTLVSLPYGIEELRAGDPVASNENLGANGLLLADLSHGSGAFMIDVNITGLNFTGLPSSASVNFTISSSQSGESIIGGAFMATDAVQWVDRSSNIRGWDNIYNTNRFSVSHVLEDSFDFQVVVDRSILEVFGNTGEKSATLVYYPLELLDTVEIRSGGLNDDVKINARIHALKGTWATGIVRPNGTAIDSRNLLGSLGWT